MTGFNRRFGYFPSIDVIQQIEGVSIVDLPPPGNINGVGTGTVCIVGEFVNATFAVQVALDGQVSSDPQPVEIFSSQDLGNGFVAIRNKKFARLIAAPIDNVTPASGLQGSLRLWRELPTNVSATVAQPIVPLSAALVSAGREFVQTAHRVKLSQDAVFTDIPAYAFGTDGAVLNATPGDFVSAGGGFSALVHPGDILVVGVLGAAGALGSDAGTYRVRSVTNDTTLVVESLAGVLVTWPADGTVLPFRLHARSTADTSLAAVPFTTNTGYGVLARPTFDTVPVGTLLNPVVVPPSGSATGWDPLSGLGGAVSPTYALTYDANIHAANVSSTSLVQARYSAALDGTLNDDQPASDINILVPARKNATIRALAKTNVLTASARGLTRRDITSPPVSTLNFNTVLGTTATGVGYTSTSRNDRVDYSWPGAQTFIPEAVGSVIATSNGRTTTDGILDTTGDEWLAAVESNLAPERNPGQAASPVPEVLAPVLGFARGTPKLGLAEYTALRAQGVCALRMDKTVGPIFQSGVTTSLISGEKNIARRRMADYIQDSIANRLVSFGKLPLTQNLKDSAVGEIAAFLNLLKSPNNPAASRITDYSIDDKSGNTPSSLARGIYVIIVRVQLTPTSDFIVLQTDIGEGVVITQLAA